MADARALLRAHRAENRIKHPDATYSEAGKLLCKLCHDVVKSESLWNAHIRTKIHRQRLQAATQKQSTSPTQGADESTNKRKRGEDADEPMFDGNEDPDTIPTKRSKTDGAVGHTSASNGTNGTGEGSRDRDKEKTQTPPGLARRTSGTPVHGVEIAIPSRPATPLASSNSTVSTPKAASMGRVAIVGLDTTPTPGGQSTALLQQKVAASIPVSNETLSASTQNIMQAPPTSNHTTNTTQAIDEAEWAAFEAEMAILDAPAPPIIANAAGHLYADTTISAPALTTAQVAAKSQEEENERRKNAAETEMADEREDATRALEDEFEEMAELEGRVRRLKERREELRKESVMNFRGVTAAGTARKSIAGLGAGGKENVGAGDDPEDDDEEDDEEDDFDGFRFRV